MGVGKLNWSQDGECNIEWKMLLLEGHVLVIGEQGIYFVLFFCCDMKRRIS